MLSKTIAIIMIAALISPLAQAQDSTRKKTFWGNDWSTSVAYTFARSHEADVNVGRSYVRRSSFNGPGGGSINAKGWGMGYGAALHDEDVHHLVKIFAEQSSAVAILGYAIRAEYIYNMTSRQHYLRPSLGFSLVEFELMYNHSIKLNGPENLFGHGVTLRIRFFSNKDNWEHVSIK